MLYANLFAYISAIEDKSLKVTINGDEDEARQIEDCGEEREQDTYLQGGESDGEDNEQEYVS